MEQTQHWSEIFERTAVGYATAYDQLSEQVKPNLHTLLAYFKAYHNYNGFDERGLEAKLEALQHEPTALEKTMTEVELYKVNSPLWVNDLTASQARAIIEAHENLLEYDDIEEFLFKHIREIDLVHQNLLAFVYTDICNRKDKLCHYL